ncbi:ATP synthase subunit I [bacterium]|nr:MAG: ATP synthase subunit I [bacterium]
MTERDQKNNPSLEPEGGPEGGLSPEDLNFDDTEGEGPDIGGEINIRRIELFNIALVIIVTLVVKFLWNDAIAFAVIVGGILMAVSFRVIASVMTAVFGRGGGNIVHVATYWLKFALMMLLVGALVLVYNLDVGGLLIGFSQIVPAIVLETVWKLANKK